MDVLQFAAVLDQEVVMIADIGVEIDAGAIDGDFAQQAGGGELVKGVIDGGQRDREIGRQRLLVKTLGGHMPVFAGEQQFGERNSLARRP